LDSSWLLSDMSFASVKLQRVILVSAAHTAQATAAKFTVLYVIIGNNM